MNAATSLWMKNIYYIADGQFIFGFCFFQITFIGDKSHTVFTSYMLIVFSVRAVNGRRCDLGPSVCTVYSKIYTVLLMCTADVNFQ